MNEKQFTISEVIDSFGITKHSWVLFIILSLAQVLDGYDFMIINSTNLFVAHTFWPNDPNPGALMGSLTTWGLLGMVIGGAFGGILSDKIGRKKVLSAPSPSTESSRSLRHSQATSPCLQRFA